MKFVVVQLHPHIIELSILLFADDIVLMADTVYGLQRKIKTLYNVSCILGLEVHAGKSNIAVFRNGGHLAANEKWHFGTADLNVVSEYTYLGIVMSTRLKLNLYSKPFLKPKGPFCSS